MFSTKKLCFVFVFLFFSCSNSSEDIKQDDVDLSELSEYETEILDYFTEIALGFEFSNSSKITRRWNTDLKVYLSGDDNPSLKAELDSIITELNNLITTNMSIYLVDEQVNSNFHIFLGSASDYVSIYPNSADLVESNWGLFFVNWDSSNYFYTGHMYVDTERADSTAQKHLLREEFTQSLGLANDSYKYSDSIFQQNWTLTTYYSDIDKELIRLLYHPNMKAGLNKAQTQEKLKEIILNER